LIGRTENPLVRCRPAGGRLDSSQATAQRPKNGRKPEPTPAFHAGLRTRRQRLGAAHGAGAAGDHRRPQRDARFILRRRPLPRSAGGARSGPPATRPYGDAVAVALEEERARLAPVLPAIIALGIPVSIDTLKAAVAAWALAQGAAVVNDVWGLQGDPDMARVVAEHGAPVIIMHNRAAADPAIDIIADVTAFFQRSLDIAARAGIARGCIVLDPGIGFGKTAEQSLACIARLDAWREFGLPLLVGASRKRFINSVTPSDPSERIGGSLAAHLMAVENGARLVRVHDVAETVQALAVAAAIRRAR
jgi:dihydropteroate synthase